MQDVSTTCCHRHYHRGPRFAHCSYCMGEIELGAFRFHPLTRIAGSQIRLVVKTVKECSRHHAPVGLRRKDNIYFMDFFTLFMDFPIPYMFIYTFQHT